MPEIIANYWVGWLLITILILFILYPPLFYHAWALFWRCTFFRLRIDGEGKIPAKGPALLISNHVAIFDFLVILAISWRRVRFMVHEDYFKVPMLAFLFRLFGIIKVPSSRRPQALKQFFDKVQKLLSEGRVVCVFPEGGVSDNGLLGQFHRGLSLMLPKDVDVPLIPIRLGMLWGQIFQIKNKKKLRFRAASCLPIVVMVTIGRPLKKLVEGFELRQLISELGAESEMKPMPGELPLHTAYARRAKRHLFHKTFKDFGGQGQSEFMMLVKSLIFAKKIRELDPGKPGGYVGVLLPNCTTLTVAMLGVLYADRQPTVLNYSAGLPVMLQAIAKADAKLVLTSRKFLEKLNLEPQPGWLCLEDVAPTITKWDKYLTIAAVALLPWRLLTKVYSPESRYDLFRPAVLLFSSGSTGIPKGVVLTHRNINADIYSFWRSVQWSPKDSVVGSLPIFHAFGYTVCFAFPILSGTHVCYAPNILDAATILKIIETEKVTLLITTPTFLQSYMRRAKPEQLKTLRLVVTGAEKLRSDIVRNFYDLTGLPITEGYGCTELSPIVSINFAARAQDIGKKIGAPDSIGASMPGVHVKIVDPETGEELPPYRSGMLMVKGPLVMQGYLKEPEMTAKVLQDGYYRTGDIASMTPNGYITITGRLSRFSKIGGEMVPHELVERALCELLESESRVVAVTGKADPKRGEKLIVFHTVEDLNPTEIILGLREKELPNLWIPKAEDFVKLDELPMLGSGKLDLQYLKKIADELE
ncbi:MAG: AMP-binding protein [Lentisphaeria bacterium]|nr:AMP-binding protein [Lentisphaeria bacterium]